MDSYDSRDLDGVIDDVARAMTSEALARDLRPAVASRLAGSPSWTFGWRVGMAAAAMAAVVLVAAVVMRPGPDSASARLPSSVASVRPGRATVTPPAEPLPAESMTAVARLQPPLAVARQRIDTSLVSDEVVDIRPLAIAAVETHPLLPVEEVEIEPIDVEPVRISALEQVE